MRDMCLRMTSAVNKERLGGPEIKCWHWLSVVLTSGCLETFPLRILAAVELGCTLQSQLEIL